MIAQYTFSANKLGDTAIALIDEALSNKLVQKDSALMGGLYYRRGRAHKIIDIELSHLYGRIEGMGYKMKVNAKAKDYIIEKGWDEQFGARPLKRAIQKYIEDSLAEEIIRTEQIEADFQLFKKGLNPTLLFENFESLIVQLHQNLN